MLDWIPGWLRSFQHVKVWLFCVQIPHPHGASATRVECKATDIAGWCEVAPVVGAFVPADFPGFCSLPACMNGSQTLDNHRWPVMGTPPQKQPKKPTCPCCKYFHKDGMAMLEGLIHACIGITAGANAFCLINFHEKLIFYEQRA